MELTQHRTTETGHVKVPRPRGAIVRNSQQTPRGAARASSVEQRSVGLGWLSLGLGLAEILAPRQVAELVGADADDETTRNVLIGCGVRELVCGVGLLSQSKPALWAWARVAGDVMDLALLGYTWQRNGATREQLLGVGGSVLGVTLVDAQTALALGKKDPLAQGIFVRQGVTINKSPDEVYAFFRNLENLPRFMSHLESVRESNGRSQWCAKGPLGVRVEWEAEVVEDRPGERLAWRSVAGADVPNQGRVEFRRGPGGAGTELVVELSYEPPVGAVGAALAKLFGREPSQEISSDLRRLKQVLETGEVLHSDASVHRGMHPARPSRSSSNGNKQVKR